VTPEEFSQAIKLVRPIPQVALKVARMISEGQHDIGEIAGQIKQDQVISAKVIRLCNSSFFGLKKRIDSIDRALVIMGEKLLLQMVISASVELFFSGLSHGYSLCKGGLFQHALGTALVAENLAGFTGKVRPEIAYTAGLLHDIGKVALDQYIASVSPYFYRITQVEQKDLCRVEKERLGYSHPEAGGLLADDWDLPENLSDAIRNHHTPDQSEVDPELSHLVFIADFLMSRFRVDQEIEFMDAGNFKARLERLGLTPAQLPALIDMLPARVFGPSIHMGHPFN
jgi:putative nucleotidyltransferase with HDIG domain